MSALEGLHLEKLVEISCQGARHTQSRVRASQRLVLRSRLVVLGYSRGHIVS